MIQTTDEHPFHAVAGGWTNAELLEIGESVSGSAEITSAVTSNRREEHPEGVAVYNMEIEGSHIYFVRDEGNDAELGGRNPSCSRLAMLSAGRLRSRLWSGQMSATPSGGTARNAGDGGKRKRV